MESNLHQNLALLSLFHSHLAFLVSNYMACICCTHLLAEFYFVKINFNRRSYCMHLNEQCIRTLQYTGGYHLAPTGRYPTVLKRDLMVYRKSNGILAITGGSEWGDGHGHPRQGILKV